MVVLVVAALASVATSSDGDSYGIVDINLEEDVLLAATCYLIWPGDSLGHVRDTYMSENGGLTWTLVEERAVGRCSTQEMRQRIDTSRGVMELRPGEGVFLVDDNGVASLEFDTSFMNERVFRAISYDELSGRSFSIGEVSIGLFDVEVEPASANMVVATGHTGVLVGLPDGSWEWVRVGPYSFAPESAAGRKGLVKKFRTVVIFAVVGLLGAATPLLLFALFRSIRDRRSAVTTRVIASALPVVFLWLLWNSEFWGFPRSDFLGMGVLLYGLFGLLVFGLLFYWLPFSSPRFSLVAMAAGLISSMTVVIALNIWAQSTAYSLAVTKALIVVALVTIIAAAFYILHWIERSETQAQEPELRLRR